MNPLACLNSLWQRPEARLGGKLLALQIVIEIPFLILKATLLAGSAAGNPRALALWQSALLVAGGYICCSRRSFG
ncbi:MULTISPECIES: hypothetical protein [Thermaceae]|uniref:Uncharacterized protein n=2 Tax=Thermaceae TaxID=188786 RepID=A0A399FBA4_9DEIN|nr:MULTISPECIES: hypothetical protein [Thermaceae]MBI5813072.1 hypothetical protein [Allomeiothermus silvanus]MCL6526415.1 hypothetical protein [Thermaceae bacterium]RIH93488.1 hypothetical protein Mgrana_00542 [Meiothermus granaticius NBRC 107808]RTI03887.1 hypothetical protein CSW30_14230 [Thermus scotoductus]GEM85983.1 hypothetical protein MGR01S_06080 [Meiothermus granaticius NBRC 107808]